MTVLHLEQDWTVDVGNKKIGIQGYSTWGKSVTIIHTGWEEILVEVPFQVVTAALIIVPMLLACALVIWQRIWRKKANLGN
jgi:hypothetical protein